MFVASNSENSSHRTARVYGSVLRSVEAGGGALLTSRLPSSGSAGRPSGMRRITAVQSQVDNWTAQRQKSLWLVSLSLEHDESVEFKLESRE